MKELVILFDLDGTLIDSTDAIVSTFYHSFVVKSFKFDGSEEDIKNLIGYPLDVMYEQLGVAQEEVNGFVEEYKKRYREISLDMTLILEDAKEALELASQYARLGIVTTKTTQYTIPLLENMGIMNYFECIVGRQEVINPKPHPEPILKAMEMMNITIEDFDIYMIGDTKLDLIAAKNANITGVGVLCGYGKYGELSQYSDIIEANSSLAVKRIIKVKN
ncbi:MAG: HAD family hydrolase [Arcobacteraceae bacterium]|jgi:phosphoglycolate phosphatase|nr:HAD family hydrolase [Arcobacteraceae bacterium]